MVQTPEIHQPVRPDDDSANAKQVHPSRWQRQIGQLLRFGIVGGLNTFLDIATLNALLWIYPTSAVSLVLLFNSLAYCMGAVNSFLLNKYWTFRHKRKTTWKEVGRFAITTLCCTACNDLIIWCVSTLIRFPGSGSPLWTNVSKAFAIAGTVIISYCGMRLWVFVKHTGNTGTLPKLDKITGQPVTRIEYALNHAEHVDRLYQACMNLLEVYKLDKAAWYSASRDAYAHNTTDHTENIHRL